MSGSNFLIFAFASLMLNLTPGNDMLYVASRSTGQGIKAGIISALGIMAGCLVHITAAVIGLSALIASSAVAFNIIKYLGAAYLVYLGWQALINKRNSAFALRQLSTLPLKKIFWQGVITNVMNPKVALFFLAFLPQFISASGYEKQWQILFLGVYFSISGTIVNIIVAIMAGKLARLASGNPAFVRIQEKITGLLLVALGIKVALSTKK